jgi:hypothetical protein
MPPQSKRRRFEWCGQPLVEERLPDECRPPMAMRDQFSALVWRKPVRIIFSRVRWPRISVPSHSETRCLAQVVRHQTRVSGLRDTNDTNSMTGDIPLIQRERIVPAL